MNEERKVINISKPNRITPTNVEIEKISIDIEAEQKQEIINIGKSEVKMNREEEIAEFNRQVDAQITESMRKKQEEEEIIKSKKQMKIVKGIIIFLFLNLFFLGSPFALLHLILSWLFG